MWTPPARGVQGVGFHSSPFALTPFTGDGSPFHGRIFRLSLDFPIFLSFFLK